MDRLVARLVARLLPAVLVALPAPVVDEPPLAWSPPVDATVVRRFAPGLGAFEAAGHAGVDYATTPGTPVRAAGDGVVAFVGDVAGATFVVVAHGAGMRTSYGQLAAVAVQRLQPIERGAALGTAGGAGMHDHDAGVLHFGLRVDGRPVDPLRLFEAPDLTEIVRLVPADDAALDVASAAAERRLAALWFSPPTGRPAWLADAGAGGGGVGRFLSGMGPGAASLVGRAAGVTGSLWAVVTSQPVPLLWRLSIPLVWEAGQGVRDWWALRENCSPGAPPAAGFPGTGNHLVAVAGVNSSSRPGGSANALVPSEVGYRNEDVTWFSYDAGGGPYSAEDTWDGPEAAAARLADQLRAFARRRPGRFVDLIGHSLGGVVVEAFLKDHYTGHERDYPPLGKVVTLAAPHRGAPLAALADRLPLGPFGDASLGGLPPRDSGTARQLAEGSQFLAHLAAEPLPSGVDVTTMGGVDDLLVPADQTVLDGAVNVVVDPAGFSDHGAILSEEDPLAAVRLALAGLPPPCRSLPEAVRNRVEPRAIHAVSDLLAR